MNYERNGGHFDSELGIIFKPHAALGFLAKRIIWERETEKRERAFLGLLKKLF